jgi:integrase
MSVYRHKKSHVWQFDFQLAGYRFFGSTDVSKDRPQREAAAFESAERRKAIELVEAAKRENREPMTLATACARWWDEVGQYTKEVDLRKALAWLCDHIGGKRGLHTIRDDDIARAVAARRTDLVRAGRDGQGYQLYRPVSVRTVNRTVTLLLKRVMFRARDTWSAATLTMPNWSEHLLKEKKRPIREITLEEEARIEAVERDDYRAIRRFATITGLRLNEVLLTWPQVDFENAVIRIIAKGDEPRIIPLSREAYALLWAERGRHEQFVFTFVARKTRTCPQTGQRYERGRRFPITYYGLSTQRRREWKKAGVDARFHDLRHTAGMRTLRATGNLKTTQKLLGHSDISTTAKFYTDALVEDVRAAMEATAEHVRSRKKSRTVADPDGKLANSQE